MDKAYVPRVSGKAPAVGIPRPVRLLLCAAALAGIACASLAIGSKEIPIGTVLDALFRYDPADPDHVLVRTLRVPRTEIGILVGLSLGLAGALMQGLTRNPLADPGIFGIESGAGLFVVLGIYLLGITDPLGFVWLAFAGAAAAAAVVYLVGAVGRGGAAPAKVALAGASVTAVLGSLTTMVLLLDSETLDRYRFWAVGSLVQPTGEVAWELFPFLAVGAVLALGCGGLLNTVALGDETARSLGTRLGLGRVRVALAVVLLCGVSVSLAGPIGFVGLIVPYLARAIGGHDYRWVLGFSLLLGPMLLLVADIAGRIVARPQELQVGIVTALVGAPVFIALVRRKDLREL